jgi:flagellar protein FlbD
MIALTRLDKQLMYLNPDHIICIEETPDTVITLFNGNRYIVTDRAETIISRIITFRAQISRRATKRSAKKYLNRITLSRFNCARSFPDERSLDAHGTQHHTPLHSRDY